MPGTRREECSHCEDRKGTTRSSSWPCPPRCRFLATSQLSQTTRKAGLSSRLFLVVTIQKPWDSESRLAVALGSGSVLNPGFGIPGWPWRTAHSVLSGKDECQTPRGLGFKDEQVTLKLFLTPNSTGNAAWLLQGEARSGKEGAGELARCCRVLPVCQGS